MARQEPGPALSCLAIWILPACSRGQSLGLGSGSGVYSLHLQIYNYFVKTIGLVGKSLNQGISFVLGVVKGHMLTGFSSQVAVLSFSRAVKSAIHTTFRRFLRIYNFFLDDRRRPKLHTLA